MAAIAALKKIAQAAPPKETAKKAITPRAVIPDSWTEFELIVGPTTKILVENKASKVKDIPSGTEISVVTFDGKATQIELPPSEEVLLGKITGYCVKIEANAAEEDTFTLTLKVSSTREAYRLWKEGKKAARSAEAKVKQQEEILKPRAWEARRELCIAHKTYFGSVDVSIGEMAAGSLKYIGQEKYSPLDANSELAIKEEMIKFYYQELLEQTFARAEATLLNLTPKIPNESASEIKQRVEHVRNLISKITFKDNPAFPLRAGIPLEIYDHLETCVNAQYALAPRTQAKEEWVQEIVLSWIPNFIRPQPYPTYADLQTKIDLAVPPENAISFNPVDTLPKPEAELYMKVESEYTTFFTVDPVISISREGIAKIDEILGKIQAALATEEDPTGAVGFTRYFSVEMKVKPTTSFHERAQYDPRVIQLHDMLRDDGIIKPQSPYFLG